MASPSQAQLNHLHRQNLLSSSLSSSSSMASPSQAQLNHLHRQNLLSSSLSSSSSMAYPSQAQLNEIKPATPTIDSDAKTRKVMEQPLDVEAQTKGNEEFDYSTRAQWLRAAILGANDGLLSTASLMMGVGAVRKDMKTMILTGIAGLVAGACSMAIGEYVSVYSQYDIEMAQIKRGALDQKKMSASDLKEEMKKLPSPFKAAAASGNAFAIGAFVPLLAASFIREYHLRLAVVIAAVSVALLVFGGLGAVMGKAPVVKSSMRVLVGGWFAMGITFGSTKLIGLTGL